MKPVTAIVLVALAGAAFFLSRAPSPDGGIAWRSWDDGVAAAKAEGKPVLVDFSAGWCGVCNHLDRTTLSDPRVIEAVRTGWVAIRVDVDREPARAHEMQIEALPTLVLLTSDGKVAARRRGFVSSSGLIDWLEKSRLGELTMARVVTQSDMERIFSVIDGLGLSREAIKVPLQPKGEGSVERIAGGLLRIVLPDGPLDPWLPILKARIEELA